VHLLETETIDFYLVVSCGMAIDTYIQRCFLRNVCRIMFK